jgi:hypothetical protein
MSRARAIIGTACLAAAFSAFPLAAQFSPLPEPTDNFMVLPTSDNRVFFWNRKTSRLYLYDPRGPSRLLANLDPYDYVLPWVFSLDQIAVRYCRIRVLPYYPESGCENKYRVYVLPEDRWREVPLPLDPFYDKAVLLSGSIVGIGQRTYLISTSEWSWKDVGPPPTTYGLRLLGFFGDAATTLSDGRVLLALGKIQGMLASFPTDAMYFLDPVSLKWSSATGFNPGFAYNLANCSLPNSSAFYALTGPDMLLRFEGIGNTWTKLPLPGESLRGTAFARLPNDSVLLSGGALASSGTASVLYSSDSGALKNGKRLSVGRTNHELVTLSDNTVLAMGGTLTADGTVTASVERISWEPQIKRTLDAGFYVATSQTRTSQDGGFTGIETSTTAQMYGAINFGGSLPAAGKDVGFAGFYLPEAQTITATVNFQPQGSGAFGVTVRLLDLNKQRDTARISGGTHIEFAQALPAGFHVIELQTTETSPSATYQSALSAPRLNGGAVAGGVLDPAIGAPGFIGFYLPERQDVTIRLYNEQTYGVPRGAGEVILTLYDASGKIVARSGPGQ